MSDINKSLEENKDAIMAAVPKELHGDCQLTSVDASEHLTGDAAVEAVKAELKANPAVDESLAADELKDIAPPAPAELPSEDELAAQQAEDLKAAEAMGAHEDSDG